jgi:anti-anti-sigma factor
MWSPFSRKSRRPHGRTAPANEHGWAANVNNCIATIDRIGPTAVATVNVPSLSTNAGVGLLMELFDELSQSGARSLVLDLQRLEYLDSVCLGCLVQALNHAIQDGGRIALVNTDSNVQDLFRVTQINRLFPICQDVPTALTAIERAA